MSGIDAVGRQQAIGADPRRGARNLTDEEVEAHDRTATIQRPIDPDPLPGACRR